MGALRGGAATALEALESGRERALFGGREAIAAVVYVALGDHVRRAAGADAALELWDAIVQRMESIVRERYGTPLVVLLWKTGDEIEGPVLAAPRGHEVTVLTTSELFPSGMGEDLHLRGDPNHPSAVAYRQVAAALLKWLRQSGTLER